MEPRRRRQACSRRDGGRADDPSALGPRARHRGQPREGAAHAQTRRAGVLRAFVGRGARRSRKRGRGGLEDGCDDDLLARLARSGAHSGPPLPRSDPALCPGDQGSHVHAHRRHHRGADHVAAGDAGRRAQLGLPLQLDARHDLHAAGAPLAQPQLGGRRVHAVRRRRRGDGGRLATDHVRDRRPSRPDRDDPRRPLRLRRRAARADRQRRLRPTPERRLRRSPRLDPAPHAPLSSVCRGGSGRSSSRRRSARRRPGGSPTRASGRPAATRSTTSRPS